MPEISEGEHLKNDMSRLVRRTEIAEKLLNKESLRQIVDQVKDSEKVKKIEKLAERIVNEGPVVNQEILPIVRDLHERLEKNFPNEGLSLAVLGSHAMGGAEVRKIFGTEGDLDLGLISKTELSSEKVDQINSVIKSELKKTNPSLDVSHNVEGTRERATVGEVVELVDVPTATERLIDGDTEGWWRMFLTITIPQETGERNRKILLESLTNLSIIDHAQWKNVIEMMGSWLESDMRIKAKHFKTPEAQKYEDETFMTTSRVTSRLQRGVQEISGKVMSERWRELLLETDMTK